MINKLCTWLKQKFCNHQFTLPWVIEYPYWAAQTLEEAICEKCGKGREFKVRVISSGEWPVVDNFDIGESECRHENQYKSPIPIIDEYGQEKTLYQCTPCGKLIY